MNNAWNNNQFQDVPSQIGQVKLFDPTQFQTPASSFGVSQGAVSKIPDHYQASSQLNAVPLQDNQSSWNSWNSWNWNDVGGSQQQEQIAPQGPPVSQFQTHPSDGQYYHNSQYSGAWNMESYSVYTDQQTLSVNPYADPGQEQQYQSHFHHQAQQPQQHDYAHGQFYDQQQKPPDHQPEQHQFMASQQTMLQANPRLQSDHQSHQFYNQQQSVHPIARDMVDTSGHWEDGFQTQQISIKHIEADNGAENNDDSRLHPYVEDNINQQAESNSSFHDNEPRTTLNISTNEEDGTVTGLFGKDEDGDVSLDRQMKGPADHIELASHFNKLHTDSTDVTSADLTTVHLSSADEDVSKKSLQNIEELVKRMEVVELSNNQRGDGLVDPGADDGLVLGQPHNQQQHTPDFVYYQNIVPPSLPIHTDVRSSSPEGDHPGSAESGGSGVSGGSSGLADWEIVPPHSTAKTLSRDLSPDSNNGFISSHTDSNFCLNRNDVLNQETSKLITGEQGHGSKSILLQETLTSTKSDHIQEDINSGNQYIGGAISVKKDEILTLDKANSSLVSVPPLSTVDVELYKRDGKNSGMPGSHQQQTSDLKKSKDNSSLLSKPKMPTGSEDGNRVSRREYDQHPVPLNTSNKSPTQHIRKSSQDSEEIAMANELRRHNSAFHPVSRPRQTAMSPATTLWDTQEGPKPNILLAPAVPLIIPSLGNTSIKTESVVKSRTRDSYYQTLPDTSILSRDSSKDDKDRQKDGRSRDDKNRSFDSLEEIDSALDRSRDRGYRNQKEARDSREPRYGSRDAGHRKDVDACRDRPLSRSGQYQYERPFSRTEGYGRDDARYRSGYRDYGDSSFDERYDRPRSRQDDSRSSRPSSRSAQGVDAERSRQDYDYYHRDRNRGYGGGYGYENYNRNVDYYNEEREKWYRYYKEKEARYARGYYEEYYGAKHAEYYQHQQQLKVGNQQEVERHYSQSRGNTPGVAASPAPGVGSTPAPRAASVSGPDYYGHNSRPHSRTDYNRDYYRAYGYHGYDPYFEAGYAYDPYTQGYGYYGYEDPSNQGYDQGRLTPPKYSYPHIRASFGPNGQLLVKVQPNKPSDGQPAIVEVQDVQRLLESCPEAEEFKQFPGPLTRINTHKKDVLFFCQQKARYCAENVNLPDRESAQLLWRFLELLIKQNGLVVGTDLSDLLLEGHEPTTHEYSLSGMKISQSLDTLEDIGEENNGSRDSPATRVIADKTVIMTADTERERWIDRFRHLLLYGRKKDALECAMKNHLWGHALFLASKMDTRTHANVMTRFANSAMRINDPLQTLYQLMSGRQPAAVTCVVDDRWGDWRPHLAMILSNQTSRNDIDRKSITTLGDTLAARGFLHASHFCYLMAQVPFGTFDKKTSKIVLIGSSHNLSMEEFASNEAIQCTEVFEYAQMLGNSAFCLPHFQLYKYLYACKLVDYGMAAEALHYLEVISTSIQQYPTMFQPSFVRLVYQLASMLKFSDPQRLQLSEDAEDPLWLQQLVKICSAFADGSLQAASGTVTPAGYLGTATSSESGDYHQGTSYSGDTNITQPLHVNTADDMYSHQQMYPVDDSHQLTHSTSGTAMKSYADPSQQQQGDNMYNAQQQIYGAQSFDYSQWQQQGHQYGGFGQEQQQQVAEQQPPHHSLPTGAPGEYTSRDSNYTELPPAVTLLDSRVHGGNKMLSSSQQSYSSYQQPTPRSSISTADTTEDEDLVDEDEDDEDEAVTNGPAAGFDYFGNVGQQKVVSPRYRTLSSSSAGSTSRRRRTISGSSTGSVKAAPYKTAPQQPQSAANIKTMNKQQGDNSGGWIGGFFNKLRFKGKNEMILPDDKNPSIVWDPVKKKWINADGTEEEESTAPPPPKDLDLLGKVALSVTSSAGAPPPVTSGPTASNRFSLKSAGTKAQYVDVNNPKPIAVPQNLFNVMPNHSTNPAALPPQFFLPGAAPGAETSVSTNSNNSNQLTVPPKTEEPSHSRSVSSLSQEIQHYFSEISADPAQSSADPAPCLPVLFNPANLKNPGPSSQSSAGPGLKYGQRRAYPK